MAIAWRACSCQGRRQDGTRLRERTPRGPILGGLRNHLTIIFVEDDRDREHVVFEVNLYYGIGNHFVHRIGVSDSSVGVKNNHILTTDDLFDVVAFSGISRENDGSTFAVVHNLSKW